MLSKFNNTITLDKKIAVIIPEVDAWLNGIEDGQGSYKREFVSMFSVFFGGATVVNDLKGYYYMSNGDLSFDNNIMVYAYYQEMREDQMEHIVKTIEKMKVELNQECIGIEYNGKFTLVY